VFFGFLVVVNVVMAWGWIVFVKFLVLGVGEVVFVVLVPFVLLRRWGMV
jgi:hypothetical protein